MPWEVTLRRQDDAPLGELSSVCQGIEAALPETQFYRELSGKEKMEAAKARGIEFPDAVKAIFENLPARTMAQYQIEGLSIVFYGFDSEPLRFLHAEIRGNGNPAEALRRVCERNAWKAIDDASQEVIDLSANIPADWQSFLDYQADPSK